MNIEKNSTLTYVVKTRFCNETNEFQFTEFTSENNLKARNEAFLFLENYIEIIANEGLLKLDSNLINPDVIQYFNHIISTQNSDNFDKIRLFNQEIISIIPSNKIFPFGITVSFRLNHDVNTYKKGDEFEVFSLEKMDHHSIENQLKNLMLEYDIIYQSDSSSKDLAIELSKSQFVTLEIEESQFRIFETPFCWDEKARQFQIDHLYNKDSVINGLYERLFNCENYDYVNFLESTTPDEIEKTVYSLFHGRGGVLYVGYHPENLTESIMSDEEIIDYVDLMNHTFAKDKYLYKNIKFEIFNFNDFPILAIIVFKLNEASKILQAYDPNKVFVLQNNTIMKIESK